VDDEVERLWRLGPGAGPQRDPGRALRARRPEHSNRGRRSTDRSNRSGFRQRCPPTTPRTSSASSCTARTSCEPSSTPRRSRCLRASPANGRPSSAVRGSAAPDRRSLEHRNAWPAQGSNLRPPACKGGAPQGLGGTPRLVDAGSGALRTSCSPLAFRSDSGRFGRHGHWPGPLEPIRSSHLARVERPNASAAPAGGWPCKSNPVRLGSYVSRANGASGDCGLSAGVLAAGPVKRP